MKTIKIIFFTLLGLILVAGTIVLIFLQTFDPDAYVFQLTRKVSIALGREVSIGHLRLGLSSRGPSLDVGPIIIADDTAFSRQPFIQIDRVRIIPDFMPFILRRQITIADVLLQSPEIHIIRSQKGDFNFRSLGTGAIFQMTAGHLPETPKKDEVSHDNLRTVKVKAENRYVSVENILPETIVIQDAAISYIDQSQSLPLDIWLLHINANVRDLSLLQPCQLSLDASPLLRKGIDPGQADSPLFKDVSVQVQFNPDSFKPGGPTAEGEIRLQDGIIKDFNVFEVILSRTLRVFGSLDAILGKLGTQDMFVDKATAQFSVHDGTVFINDSLIQTNIFELTAQGSVDRGLKMDMQTMLHLNADVSADLVNAVDGLQFLMDDSKRIAIGGNVSGVIPHVKYKPNKEFRKKSKKALISLGGNIFKSFFH